MMPKPKRQLALNGFESYEEQNPSADPRGKKTCPSTDLPKDKQKTDSNVLKGRTVYVVDSHSLIFQVFHAIGEITNPQGEPVNAIFGFTRDLLFLLKEKKPDFIFCAFDQPGPTFRHKLYPEYKADRGEMPEDLAVQFPGIRQITEAFNIPVLHADAFEADDILATVAEQADRSGADCYLVTSDKDCRQLITERVKIYNIRKQSVYDQKNLSKDWGIRADQVVDFQSLVGDSVDNVPGVARIGPKTATTLLQQYDTLESIFSHLDDISGAKQTYLQSGREDAIFSRKLVQLAHDVPLDLDWSAAEVSTLNIEESLRLFHEFGFRSLLPQLHALGPEKKKGEKKKNDYLCVDRLETLQELVAEWGKSKQISIDVETTSLQPSQAEIVGYSFSIKPGHAYYVPVRAPAGQQFIDAEEAVQCLKPLLENARIGKVGQNLKYDLVVLRNAGIRVAGVTFDTMIASYLLEAGQRGHGLDALALHYLGHETIKIESLIGKGKDQRKMDEVALEEITDYAAEDADIPLQLKPVLAKLLTENQLSTLFENLEMPLVEVLAEMEYTGIRVDIKRLKKLSKQFGARLDALEAEIYELADGNFNIASPKQLAHILFEKLELPVIKKTKTGPSTDADVLEQLAEHHPLPEKIIEYRQFAKLKNTYVDALPELVHPKTGRVHASFNQVVAATGRLSSSDPNLQNIPVRSEEGREIRSAFLPGKDGWKLLGADYSQIELRVLAHYAQDEALIKAFDRDEDIHALVASQIHDVSPADVTDAMRRSAKAVNFGVIYGQSPFGLAKALHIDRDEAAEFIDAYFARYPQIDAFLIKTLEECRKLGYVSTLFGRRREIRGIRSESPGRQRNLAERMAINTVIQGSAADLTKQSMINISQRIDKEFFESKMLLQIHDELVFEVPPEELEALETSVRHEMESVAKLAVPLKVDVKCGNTWAEI